MAFALNLPKPLGGSRGTAAAANLDLPAAQVSAAGAPEGYDPLASVSVMEQMRSTMAETGMPTGHCGRRQSAGSRWARIFLQ